MENTTFLSEISHFLCLGGASMSLILNFFARKWEWGDYWDGFFVGIAIVLLAGGVVSLIRKFREISKNTKRYGNY